MKEYFSGSKVQQRLLIILVVKTYHHNSLVNKGGAVWFGIWIFAAFLRGCDGNHQKGHAQKYADGHARNPKIVLIL